VARIQPSEYERLDLRAHSLLAEVPLHDVWAVDLPGGGPGRSVEDLRSAFSADGFAAGNTPVRWLFALRSWLGRRLGWDREPQRASERSFLHKLSGRDREVSLVEPGTPDGPFRALYVTPREAISEIQNQTVHAFSVFALAERPGGYRFYWSIYVRPTSRWTLWYMRLINPFRRFIIYPAVLRQLRKSWDAASSSVSG
jgi:hypothetical protein